MNTVKEEFYSNARRYLKSIPLWLPLLVLGFITYYSYEVSTNADMGEYMTYALNIFLGRGYTDMDGTSVLLRGPFFPLMIAGSYWLLGVSPWSAAWVVRIFCILNPIVVYFIGKRVYGKFVGFGAGLLILTSYGANFWSYRHVDAVWPFFIFVSMLSLIAYIENGQIVYLVLSSICIALGYLVKEVSIVFFPLASLTLWMRADFSLKSYLKDNIVFYSLLTLALLPWFVRSGYIFGAASPGLEALSFGKESLIGSFQNIFLVPVKGLSRFYNGHQNSLDHNLVLPWLFVIAVLYASINAVYERNRVKIVLVMSVFLFLPILICVGIVNLRFGQVSFFYYIMYLFVASFIFDVCLFLSNLVKRISKKTFVSSFFLTAIFFLILVQMFLPGKRHPSGMKFLQKSIILNFYNDKMKYRVRGVFGQNNRKISQMIAKVIPPNNNVMVSDKGFILDGRGLYFFTKGQYKIFEMPFVRSFDDYQAMGFENDSVGNDFLFLDAKSGRYNPLNYFSVLTEERLFDSVKRHGVKYIVLYKYRTGLRGYFSGNPNFIQVGEGYGGRFVVYAVQDELVHHGFDRVISSKALRLLRECLKERPNQFEGYINDFFKPALNIGKDQLKEMIRVES